MRRLLVDIVTVLVVLGVALVIADIYAKAVVN